MVGKSNSISASTSPSLSSSVNASYGASSATSCGAVAAASVSKSSVQEYCQDQLSAIRRINGIESLHTPASFVTIAAFIGYLSRLAYGNNGKRDCDSKMYIQFITDVLGSIKYDYKKMAKDMYYVFRCGLVHAYSFQPPVDAPSPMSNIAISHSSETKWDPKSGFYSERKNGKTYTVLNADDLILDLFKAIDKMFKDPVLGPHAVRFALVQQPIRQI